MFTICQHPSLPFVEISRLFGVCQLRVYASSQNYLAPLGLCGRTTLNSQGDALGWSIAAPLGRNTRLRRQGGPQRGRINQPQASPGEPYVRHTPKPQRGEISEPRKRVAPNEPGGVEQEVSKNRRKLCESFHAVDKIEPPCGILFRCYVIQARAWCTLPFHD